MPHTLTSPRALEVGSATSMPPERTPFFSRISNALDDRPPTPIRPIDVARLAHPHDDLRALFITRARDCGMSVHESTRAHLASRLADLLLAHHATRVAHSEFDGSDELRALLALRGIDLLKPDAPPDFDAHAGVSGVLAAIAETGSLVCASDPVRARSTSLVPPVHVAIVRRSQILPDLLDFFAHPFTGPTGTPASGVVLITGPSKTADIEGILITGVHGPRDVHIFLVDDTDAPTT